MIVKFFQSGIEYQRFIHRWGGGIEVIAIIVFEGDLILTYKNIKK